MLFVILYFLFELRKKFPFLDQDILSRVPFDIELQMATLKLIFSSEITKKILIASSLSK
jgi:hypothetical protein